MSLFGWTGFLAAYVGHTACLVYSLNWWYGNGIPHRVLGAIRVVHGFLVAAFPLLFWRTFGIGTTQWPGMHTSTQWLLGGYVVVCWVVAFGVLPAITVARLVRRPGALAHNHTRTIDVTGALGYRPAGRSKHRWMAFLPGNQIFQVDFTEKSLRISALPDAWEGLRILHLSDFHLTGTPDRTFFQYVMERCRAMEPDLVCVTGDIVDSPTHHRWMLPLLGRLRWREAGLAICGNHEAWHDAALVRRRLRRVGLRVLGNGWELLHVRGVPLAAIGNEWPWFGPRPDLRQCPADLFRLCLSHTPDNIAWARQHRVNLMLSGHNHGGQIRLPMIGSILVPSRYSRRFDCGLFDLPPTVLHVTRGLSGQHPVRYHCRPEVAQLILHRSE